MDLEESGSFELSQPIAAGQTTVVDPNAGYQTAAGRAHVGARQTPALAPSGLQGGRVSGLLTVP
jgi:hypothetical protein